MACSKDHSNIQDIMNQLPSDQGRIGRHKCAACAYEKGVKDGREMITKFDLEEILSDIECSQAQMQRHKSPHAAYIRGYYDGLNNAYR